MRDSYREIDTFSNYPLFSYKRLPSLDDKLVKSDIGPGLKMIHMYLAKQKCRCYPCLSCINCEFLKKGEYLKHPSMGVQYRIRHYLTCNSTYILYALRCPCGLVYIGETKNDFKTRINQHRHSIRKGRKDLPVPTHFIELGQTEHDLKCMMIDHVPPYRRGGGGGDRLLTLKKGIRSIHFIHLD